MGQVLSQDEVDALLSAVSTGELESAIEDREAAGAAEQAVSEMQTSVEVRPYDLTSQDRIFRGKMPMLEVIHEKFCRDFRSALSIELRRVVDVEVGDIRLIKFSEFLNSLPLPTSINLFKMEPFRGMGAMIIESNFTFVLVNIYLGGSGKVRFRVEGRDFTSIELNIVRKVVLLALQEFQKAWDPVEPVNIGFQRTEINPQFVSIAHPTEIVLIVESSVDVEGNSGLIQIVLPYAMIEPIKEKLSSGFLGEGSSYDDKLWRNVFEGAVREADIELVMRYGQAQLTIGELISLEEGQVLQLEKFSDEPMEILVEDVLKYTAVPGVERGYKAAKILKSE
ncbi:MAG TPA: flagellar motor switch protein FliM [bacterium]|nr:flagellar motor switch protein FliM [bacterium]